MQDQNENLTPLLFFGSQAAAAIASFAAVGYFFVYAHRSLPPSTHTRSKHVIEHRRLALFISLGLLSSFIAIFTKVNWLVSSYRHWQLDHNVVHVNTVWRSYTMTLSDKGLQLGSWYRDNRIWHQYFYGILENPALFHMVSQALVAMIPFSLFVGIESLHRNIPWFFSLGFVVLGQLVGISAALNLFFAALILTPVPLLSRDLTAAVPKVPSSTTLLVPSLVAISWVALIPAFLDFKTWPIVCYGGFAVVPWILATLPKLSSFLRISTNETIGDTRKAYASVFRILALSSVAIHFAEMIGLFSKVAPPRETLRHNYLWLYESKNFLTRREQIQITLGKVLGSLSSDPIIASTLWDVLLAGASISLWALVQNIHMKSIFNGLGLENVFSSESSRTPSIEPDTDAETPRKRGRPKKNSGEDGAFVPSANTALQIKSREQLDGPDDDSEQGTEAGAFAWVLFFFTGLGTTLSTVLGSEVSGG